MTQNSTLTPTTMPHLRTIGIALICISAILSLRNLPLMAGQGMAAIFYYVVAAIAFFIPIALVCAELGSGWPEAGGVYKWIEAAFGRKLGFFAVWLHWIEGVVCLPLFMYFTASILSYLIHPGEITFTWELFWIMQALLWSLTMINYFSPRLSDSISQFGTFLGTLLPGAIVILLGFSWWWNGHPIPLECSFKATIPEMSLEHLSFFAGVILSFSGVEIAAYHIRSVARPQKTFPQAILLAVVAILLVSILGTLAVAFVVPKEQLIFGAGVLQALDAFLKHFGFQAWMPLLAGALLVGAIALLNTWVIGPCKGMMVGFAERGSRYYGSSNPFGAPGAVLIMQGILTSLLSLIFIIFDATTNGPYWLLTVIASQLFLILYAMIFIAAVWLRVKAPSVQRVYQVPGGLFGLSVVSLIGLLACILVFIVSFVPPEGVLIPANIHYAGFIAAGVLIFVVPPWIPFGDLRRKALKRISTAFL